MNESFEWVKKNIDSCKNPFQLDCCYTLLVLFKAKYEDDLSDIEGFSFTDLYDQLSLSIINKQTFLNV